MHIDVNNAFLAWHTVYLLKQGGKIDYRNKLSVVGGDESKRRGIVLAKSESAKKRGIKTGETLYSARKKALGLHVIPVNHMIYKQASDELFAYLKDMLPDIERYSVDECFIDYTSVLRLYGDPVVYAHKLKEKIKKDLGYTVNIGIGHNKFLAKMASEMEKPDLVHTLFTDEISNKLWPLPIEKMHMVGRKTAIKLRLLGIETISDLAHTDLAKLTLHFKNKFGIALKERSLGVDPEEVLTEEKGQKGISKGQTLAKDVTNASVAKVIITELTNEAARKLRKQGDYAKVVGITLKNNQFFRYSHQAKLKMATNNSNELTKAIYELFIKVWQKDPIRNITVSLGDFTKERTFQTSLFDEELPASDELQSILETLEDKYGAGIIKKAIQKSCDKYL